VRLSIDHHMDNPSGNEKWSRILPIQQYFTHAGHPTQVPLTTKSTDHQSNWPRLECARYHQPPKLSLWHACTFAVLLARVYLPGFSCPLPPFPSCHSQFFSVAVGTPTARTYEASDRSCHARSPLSSCWPPPRWPPRPAWALSLAPRAPRCSLTAGP
jgi:hypothetical protein